MLVRLMLLLLAAVFLYGCSAAGAYIGARQDAEGAHTKVIKPSRAGEIPSGAMLYATLPGRETAKGRMRGVADSNGIRFLRIETPEGRESLPLDSVSDLVAEIPDHGNLKRGLVIGGAIDLGVLLAGSALYYLLITNIQPVY